MEGSEFIFDRLLHYKYHKRLSRHGSYIDSPKFS